MAPTNHEVGTYQKRAYGLFAEGETLPRYVVYTYFAERETHNGAVAQSDYPAHMREILTCENQPIQQPTIAVCYSISNLQARDLLGRLYDNELKVGTSGNIASMVTLSPVPGYETWLEECAEKMANHMLDAKAKKQLREKFGAREGEEIKTLAEKFRDETYREIPDADLPVLQDIVRKTARYYLLQENQQGPDDMPRAPDGVQRLHQGNGALLAKITPQGKDFLVTHPHGISQNKVNISYAYGPKQARDANKQAFKGGQRRSNHMVWSTHAEYTGRIEPDATRQTSPLKG
jgi:Malonyl-CoA decarboxylase (MCD).